MKAKTVVAGSANGRQANFGTELQNLQFMGVLKTGNTE